MAMRKGFKIDAKGYMRAALRDVGVRASTLFPSVEAAKAVADKAGLQDGDYKIHAVTVTSHRIR